MQSSGLMTLVDFGQALGSSSLTLSLLPVRRLTQINGSGWQSPDYDALKDFGHAAEAVRDGPPGRATPADDRAQYPDNIAAPRCVRTCRSRAGCEACGDAPRPDLCRAALRRLCSAMKREIGGRQASGWHRTRPTPPGLRRRPIVQDDWRSSQKEHPAVI